MRDDNTFKKPSHAATYFLKQSYQFFIPVCRDKVKMHQNNSIIVQKYTTSNGAKNGVINEKTRKKSLIFRCSIFWSFYSLSRPSYRNTETSSGTFVQDI